MGLTGRLVVVSPVPGVVQKNVCVVDVTSTSFRTNFAAAPDREELGREPVASERRMDILVDIVGAVRRAFARMPALLM